MRRPEDLPRRPRTPRSNRARGFLVAIGVVALFGFVSLRGIAAFYTDFLWFSAQDRSQVFTTILGAKVSLVVVFSVAFFAICWVNLVIADRVAPVFRAVGPEDEITERYRELVGNRAGTVRLVIAAVFGLLGGVGQSVHWNSWLLFNNGVDFGWLDPQFKRDASFYVFRLPFLNVTVGWLFSTVFIVLLLTAAAHYVNGGIRAQAPGQHVTPQVKAHLSVLLAVLALLKAGAYWLQRFGLTTSDDAFVRGAGYTDVHARLPVLTLLCVISLFAAGLLIYNIRRRGFVLPAIAVGLWAFVAVVAGGIYPQLVQRFSVEPSESTKEAPYIEHNIKATRYAMGLNAVESESYDYDAELTATDLDENKATIRNVRLLDPNVVRDSFNKLQALKAFYSFPDELDIDRYELDGEVTQVVIGARQLKLNGLSQKTWENLHLAYTHGYGAAAAPANAVTADGSPSFFVEGVPVESAKLPVDKPEIYVGENQSGYAVVDTARDEIGYEDEDGKNVPTKYDGDGGVALDSFGRKLAFSLRFGDTNLLFSKYVTPKSRVLYVRDVEERIRALAPFLRFDSDPYPTIVGGRIVYLADAYTTTDKFPYGQEPDVRTLRGGSGLATSFNYARNSVKAAVDAYTGETTFYVFDAKDPILRAYRKAFPGLFVDASKMDDSLRAHVRFPEDLFRLQTNLWGRYHISEPADFFRQSDGWSVAPDPSAPGTVTPSTLAPGAAVDPTLTPAETKRIDPYYLLMRLPGEEDEQFVLFRPFVPVSTTNDQKRLTAFMVASSDPDTYGQLKVFEMPRNDPPAGPQNVTASIEQDAAISSVLTPLRLEGSETREGNLLLIPIGNSLLYVQPLYLQAKNDPQPQLKYVIVYHDGKVVMRPTFKEALEALFGTAPETQEEAPDDDAGETPNPSTPAPERTVSELLDQAAKLFDEADAALKAGDLAGYQAKVNEARRAIDQAKRAGAPPPTSTTEAPATSSV